MDRLHIEQQLVNYSLCIISKPTDAEVEELKESFDVTDLGNGQIKIRYK